MTVGELMGKLREVDPRLPVIVWADVFASGACEATEIEKVKDMRFNVDRANLKTADALIIQ